MKAHHKVGVLRVKEGQRNEEDIFCNCHESGHFDEFLNVLGKQKFDWLAIVPGYMQTMCQIQHYYFKPLVVYLPISLYCCAHLPTGPWLLLVDRVGRKELITIMQFCPLWVQMRANSC